MTAPATTAPVAGETLRTTADAVVPAAQSVTVALAVGNPDVCAITPAVRFATASSFVVPTADHQRTYATALDRMLHGTESLLVVGHTDDVGRTADNLRLSERRARGAQAVLSGDVPVWEANFQIEDTRGRTGAWGDAEFDVMLGTTQGGPVPPGAIAAHRAHTPAGQALRATLFPAYFDKLLGSPGISPVIHSTTPPTLGCGEQHVLAPGADAASRRAEFFLVLAGTSPPIACGEYPLWSAPCAPAVLPVSSGFFVSVTGDDAGGDGTSTRPWRTIAHATSEIAVLRRPGEHVTLNVLGGTYAENVLLSADTDLVGVGDPRPTVRGVGDAPTVLVERISGVGIKHLAVTGGRRSGIRVDGSRDVVIEDCEITRNFAPRGGGVAVLESQGITLRGCTVSANTGGTIGTALTAADLDIAITSFEVETFSVTIGDAHGGGVYLQNSTQVSVRDNTIEENTAILFGGGIAVDNDPGTTGSADIEGNLIRCNQVSHGGLGPLEAPGPTCVTGDMGDPVSRRIAQEVPVVGDRAAAKAVPLLHGVGVESGLGGGVALRHVDAATRLLRNVIGGAESTPNRARRGGGVECYTGAYPFLEDNTISFNLSSDDGGGIAIDSFDPFLPAGQPTFLSFRRALLVPRQPIRLRNNQIRRNRSIEDGGGLYATGAAHVDVVGGDFTQNRAGQNGGGLRTSYASVVTVTDTAFSFNQSNTIRGDKPESEGGGGIAARNAEVTLRSCKLTGNVANQFAGGGAYLIATFEGGFNAGGFIANRRGQFDDIMETDFTFTARHYLLDACRGGDNQATGASGAGGYLYAVRSAEFEDGQPLGGVMPMEVTIRGAGTAIGANMSTWEKPANKHGIHQKRGNVVIELSGRRTADGQPEDKVHIAADVRAAPTGIAPSIPAPDGRPVVVIHDGRQTLPVVVPDDTPESFPYQNVGPSLISAQPPFGPPAGGTPVAITATGLLAGATVTIGGRSATAVTVTSDTRITATTPSGPLGPAELRVTNPDGRSATLPGTFEYVGPPTVTRVDPPFGPFSGGQSVTVFGTQLRPGASVLFGSQPASEARNPASGGIGARTPPSPSGGRAVVDVTVRNADGQSATASGAFEYVPPPHIVSVTPRSGPRLGGTDLTITGTGLAFVLVHVGGNIVTPIRSSDTQVSVRTPPGPPGPSDVRVSRFDGQSDVVPDGFVYLTSPSISGLNPTTGPAAGGTTVDIGGSDFQSGARVRFGTVGASSVTVVSATSILVDTPPLPGPQLPGPVTVEIVNPDGGTGVLPNGFTYQ